MRSVDALDMRAVGGAQGDCLVEHHVGIDAVPAEEATGIAPLVGENAFVAEGVDGDAGSRVDRHDGGVGRAGQIAPEDVVVPAGQVVIADDRAGTRWEDDVVTCGAGGSGRLSGPEVLDCH